MLRALGRATILFGAACCAIALGHVAFGPAVIPGALPANATMDSEDRFYAVLFLGFGAALIWCARELRARAGAFRVLLAVFFAGGVARLVSVAAAGWPHPLFIALTAVELLLPPALAVLHQRALAALPPRR